MTKKLLAILICLGLLPALALAEEASLPCAHVTVDSLMVTVGEQSFEPALSAVVDVADACDGELLSFHLVHDGDTLLPVHAKRNESGIAVTLNDSQVYLLSPELLGEPTEVPVSIGELLGINAQSLPDMMFGLVEFLNAQPEDEFVLDQSQLAEWPAEIQLPEIRVNRDAAKYTLTVDDVTPVYLTHDERMVSLKLSDTDYSGGLQVYRDGNVQMSLLTSSSYARVTDTRLTLKLQYTPAEDGSANYSMTADYDDACIYSNWGRLFLSVNGAIDADGASEYKIRCTDDNHLLGVPLGAQFALRLESASMTDRIQGKDMQIVGKNMDDASINLTFALMGMMGDVEKLTTDPTVAAIFNAVSALQMEYYGETFLASPTL